MTPDNLADVDLFADCAERGHVFGPIRGHVRPCLRHGCTQRDGLDPDDYVTAGGDVYDHDDPERPELGYCDGDAYLLRRPKGTR